MPTRSEPGRHRSPAGTPPATSGSEHEAVADPAAVIAGLTASLKHLREDGPAPGRAWCAAWTSCVDAALRDLAAPVLDSHRLAVVAVGGYGRGELCPASDVDLLVLHDRLEHPVLEAAVRAVVYPLWDAGLTVGYAVRDRREALHAVAGVDAATAMLDQRTVAGDDALARQVRTEAVRRLSRRQHRFLGLLRAADDERRARAGDAAEMLEPDLKNGAGGLRDVQSLRWAAAALVGSAGLDPLVAAGYLGAPDRPRLVRAEDRLLAARVALHLAAGRTDVLRLDIQDDVALRLGYRDRDDHDLAPHQLLRDLYLAARTVDHTHRRAWTLIDADVARGRRRRSRPTDRVVDGFELVDGVLRIPAERDVDEVDLPARLLAALAESGAVLDRASAARLRARIDEGDVPWGFTAVVRERVLAVLWRGHIALPALAELDDVGMLTALIPEWTALRGRPQRNPFHRYALDRHAWHAAAELGDLVRRHTWAADTLGDVEDREGLLLGTLLHDVGKAFGEPHNITGVAVAQSIARRMAVPEGTIALVGRMVSLHLLLPDAARKRDISDPALADELAAAIGDRSMLACLHLLAVADGRATGPTAWSDWTASLVDSLVTKVRAVLDEKHPDEVAEGAVVTAHAAQQLAPELGADAGAVRDHLATLPARYAAAVSPRAVVRHTLMARTRPGPSEVRTRVTPGEGHVPGPGASTADEAAASEGLDELDVVAIDHPGWFAKVAGVVAMHGGSIVAADAFTRGDGLSVDTFRVRRPEGTGGAWWARVEGDLADAAAGRLAVRARVARKAKTEQRRVARLPAVATTVSVSLDASGSSTVVEVRTLDRVGVLYAIAAALAELELDIVVARIQTVGHEVVDVFFVRDSDDKPLAADHVAELELGVTSAIAEL